MIVDLSSWPNGPCDDLIRQAASLPLDNRFAAAFPLGGSTFRALLVDATGKVLADYELPRPASKYFSLAHAQAAAIIRFGCRPALLVGSLPGPVPRRGRLVFTNLGDWLEFDRDQSQPLFGIPSYWLNDGAAGYFGLPAFDVGDFVVLQEGDYQAGDPRAYAIWGTGNNVAVGPHGREDGHGPFAALDNLQYDYIKFLSDKLDHRPDWEEACSGGTGFRYAFEFYLERAGSRLPERHARVLADFNAASDDEKGRVVTRHALAGNYAAVVSARMVCEIAGAWLGANAVASQVTRMDICPGILADEEMCKFALHATDFLPAFRAQGRSQFADQASKVMLTVCRRNPESVGARMRAAALLRGDV